MTDQTQLFFEISRQKWEQIGPNRKPQIVPPKFDPDQLTKECININNTISDLKGYLIKIRPAYLTKSKKLGSLDTLTDKQREEIDYETRMIVQRQLTRLEGLESMEKQRVERHNSRSAMKKFLADPRNEGIEKTLEAHRQGVFMFLKDQLKEVSDLQASQQEIRLSRQLEKTKSTLHHIPDLPYPSRPSSTVQFQDLTASKTSSTSSLPHSKNISHGANGIEVESDGGVGTSDASLPPELIQELEQENNALLDELELSLEKAKSAEKSMVEIAQLQTTLATHLAAQTDMIQNLVEDAFSTTGDVTAANKQLDNARSRNRRTSKIIIYASVIIALILLFNDYML